MASPGTSYHTTIEGLTCTMQTRTCAILLRRKGGCWPGPAPAPRTHAITVAFTCAEQVVERCQGSGTRKRIMSTRRRRAMLSSAHVTYGMRNRVDGQMGSHQLALLELEG